MCQDSAHQFEKGISGISEVCQTQERTRVPDQKYDGILATSAGILLWISICFGLYASIGFALRRATFLAMLGNRSGPSSPPKKITGVWANTKLAVFLAVSFLKICQNSETARGLCKTVGPVKASQISGKIAPTNQPPGF